jgi:hypothetical protein
MNRKGNEIMGNELDRVRKCKRVKELKDICLTAKHAGRLTDELEDAIYDRIYELAVADALSG